MHELKGNLTWYEGTIDGPLLCFGVGNDDGSGVGYESEDLGMVEKSMDCNEAMQSQLEKYYSLRR